MSLVNSLEQNFEFRNNLVIKINDTYFAKYVPDSGLSIDSDKLIVTSATINPTQLDLKRATTQINTATVKMIDGIDGQVFNFSSFMGASNNSLINDEIEIYFGRVNESMPFSDYIQISKYLITDIKKSGPKYNIRCRSQEDKTITPAFDQSGNLDSGIDDSVLSIDVDIDEDIFDELPSTGFLNIENEYLQYSAKSFSLGVATFTIAARGAIQSDNVAHDANEEVFFVQELNGNPIDLILQLLVSKGGGGSYDVLPDGAGIDESLIDITEFQNIRDTFFSTDIFTLYISNTSKLIKYIEDNLLVANNVRIIKNSLDNKISLAILDQSDLTEDIEEIDDSTTLKDTPMHQLSKNEIQTVVRVRWGWVEGLQKFTRTNVFKADDDTIATFGEIKGATLDIKGAQPADNGGAIITDRANRYLERFSTPRAQVSLSAFMSEFKHNIGDKIRVTAKHLPQEGGGLGMSSVIELVNRSVDLATGIVKLGFRFTSYSNIRIGIISPSPILNLTITDQKTVEVPDGACYAVGYKIRLFNVLTRTYAPDPVNTITAINGNFLTFENDFTTTLSADYALFFADYDESSAEQQSKYAYIAPDTDVFADGTKAYQIII